MKPIETMSVEELFQRRGEVWKAYYVSLSDLDESGIRKYANELDIIDELLYKRIHE